MTYVIKKKTIRVNNCTVMFNRAIKNLCLLFPQKKKESIYDFIKNL